MHEGVWFRNNIFWQNDSCENLNNFSLIRLLYTHRLCLHGPINSYHSFWWNYFDTLPIQCKHIEHMHEGVMFRKNNFWQNVGCENLDNFSLIRLLYMHRWCLHRPINSYYSFWWNNLILCRYNVDTLNICMKEFGSQKIILTKGQLWELRQLFPYMAFVYAWIAPLWADQVLLQLLMEQFDTLPTQCRHIKHMHEGVYNFCLHRFYWNLLIKTKVFLFEL